MRLATFNVLNGRAPMDARVQVDRFASAVESLDADVLALQEVDRNQSRSGHADLTAVAAEAMGARNQQFVAAMAGSPGEAWSAATGREPPDAAAYGVALLSRYPVRDWRVLRLPALPAVVPTWHRDSRRLTLVRDEARVAVAGRVGTPRGELTVVNTHLSFVWGWGRHQLRRLLAALGDESPLVLMGDLNMSLPSARAATRMTVLAAEPTFPADRPVRQLDHILGRRVDEWGSVRAVAHELAVSDHRALTVDLD